MGGQVNNPYGRYYVPIYPYAAAGAPSPYFTLSPTSGMNQPDVFNHSGNGQQEKKSQGILGAIKDFGKGIVNGAINTVKSLFTLKGLALALGTIALAWAAPALAIPLLVLGGLAYGGVQIFKGISTGNWEKAGEGVFTIGATLLGAKFGTKLEPTIKDAGGAKYIFTKTKDGNKVPVTGLFDKLAAYSKSLLPIKSGKLSQVDDDGAIVADATKGAYQLGWESISKKFEGLRGWLGFRRAEGGAPAEAGGAGDVV